MVIRCSKWSLDSELKRAFNELNASTFEECLSSGTIPQTQSQNWQDLLCFQRYITFITSWYCLNNERCRLFQTNNYKCNDFFVNILCSSAPRYRVAFCEHISSNIRIKSLEISPFSHRTIRAFKESTLPCWILLKVKMLMVMEIFSC